MIRKIRRMVLPREKFKTLTEQMYYILICLKEECSGVDIMADVKAMTGGRIIIGPGTLYNLLDQFRSEHLIVETKKEGRRRSYKITQEGINALIEENNRMHQMLADYEKTF